MNHLEFIKSLSASITHERIKLNYTQKQMASALGLSLSTYKRIESGQTEKIDAFTLYKLYTLSGKLGVEFLNIPGSTLISKLNQLSQQQKDFIESIIDFEADFSDHKYDDYISVIIPTGNLEDGMIWDSVNIEKVCVPHKTDINCGIKITSNHLHPVYVKGDIILISKRPVRDGDTGIFINKADGRAYIRKYQQTDPCLLVPLNDYGQTFKVNSTDPEDMAHWIKFGVVVSKVR